MKSYANQYFSFLDCFVSGLRNRSEQVKAKFPVKMRNIGKVLETFAVPTLNYDSPAFTKSVEWNPFNQRLMVYRENPRTKDFESDFMHVSTAIRKFTLTCHEGLHVLLWEPFFVGKFRPRSAKAHRELALGFEGFCFWYTDIFQAKIYREKMPDGEFAYIRSALNFNFQPFRPLQQIGIRSDADTLRWYIDSFSGKGQTPKKSNYLIQKMAHKFKEFYLGSQLPLAKFVEVVAEQGVFSEFFDRFCNIPNLPTFSNGNLAHLLVKGNTQEYTRQVFRMIQGLDNVAPSLIERIRCRRELQTRAYFLYLLKWMITKNKVLAVRSGFSATAKLDLVQALESNLISIQCLLTELADQKKSLVEITRALQLLDKAYTQRVQKKLEKYQVWSAERYMIMPAPQKLGICKMGPITSVNQRSKLARTIAGWIAEENFELKRSPGLYSRVAKVLARLERSGSMGKQVREELAKLLADPAILPFWSVPAWKINPGSQAYRELYMRFV